MIWLLYGLAIIFKYMLKIWASFLLIFVVWAGHSRKPVYTQVTFLYDIKRGDLNSWRKRSFQQYLGFFEQLLRTQSNLIVFGDKKLQEFVWKRRQQHNTVFVQKELSSFKSAWYANMTEQIRQELFSKYGKDHEEPQFPLQYYCLIVFGKLYVMSEAIKYDRWNSDFLLWTDAGILHALDKAKPYENFVKRFYQTMQPQWMFTNANVDQKFMYFTFKETQSKYLGRKMLGHEQIAAGVMGGDIHIVKDISNAFQLLLRITLENGDMFSEQSVLAFVPIRYSFLIPITSTFPMDKFSNQAQLYGQVRKDHLVIPRYFQARINMKGKAFITSQGQRADQQKTNKTIASYIQAIKHDIQAQGRLIGPFSSFKKATDRLIIRRKAFLITVLWVFLLLIFCNNRNLEKILARNCQKIEMFS